MKKSSFSAREYLEQVPLDEDIKVRDGAAHIPIHPLQKALDFFDWGTRNFQWQIFKDGYAKVSVAASLELVLSYEDDNGNKALRSFIGACNFSLASLAPIPDFLATAKSLCIKNAASDAGRKLGRGLNDDIVPAREVVSVSGNGKGRMKPDSGIMKQYLVALESNDQETIETLTKIYDIKTEDNGDETI